MNKNERAKLIRAMEFIAAQINDEEICLGWRAAAVADAGIEYGDLSNNPEGVEPYIDDESFADVMDTFLWCCKDAWASDGLFCDGVRSGGRYGRIGRFPGSPGAPGAGSRSRGRNWCTYRRTMNFTAWIVLRVWRNLIRRRRYGNEFS